MPYESDKSSKGIHSKFCKRLQIKNYLDSYSLLHFEFLQRCGKICEYGSRYYAVSESNVYIILNKKIIFLEQYHNFFFKFSCKNVTELDLKILEQICIALEANKTAVLYPELRHNLFRLTDDYEKSIEYSKEDFQKTILSNYRNWMKRLPQKPKYNQIAQFVQRKTFQ